MEMTEETTPYPSLRDLHVRDVSGERIIRGIEEDLQNSLRIKGEAKFKSEIIRDLIRILTIFS